MAAICRPLERGRNGTVGRGFRSRLGGVSWRCGRRRLFIFFRQLLFVVAVVQFSFHFFLRLCLSGSLASSLLFGLEALIILFSLFSFFFIFSFWTRVFFFVER